MQPDPDFIRQSMRKTWGARVDAYIAEAAPNTAQHTKALLELQPARPGERVLDVATGPGVVALAAALQVGPQGSVVATDLAPEWEPHIQRRADELGLDNVTFRAMGAESLDLPDDSFDVAYCQFGLMFVPDPVQALREMRRVLKPGGRLGAVVWSTPDRVPCFTLFSRRLAHFTPPDAPERLLPTPLALGEPGLIERHATAAGFQHVTAERRTLDFVSHSFDEIWRHRVVEGPPAIKAGVTTLSEEERARIRTQLQEDLAPYTKEGAIRLPSEAIYLTAVK